MKEFGRPISLRQAVSYLGLRGWRTRSEQGLIVCEGPADDDDKPIIALIPNDETCPDYPLRLEDLISVLSKLEERPATEIADEMATVTKAAADEQLPQRDISAQKPLPTPPFSIFLSHAERDKKAADDLAFWLESLLTVKVFVSTIQPGMKWRDKIEIALQQCKVAIVLATENSLAREWIHYEAGAINALGKPLIPLCLGRIKKSDLPSTLDHTQACEYSDTASRRLLVGAVADYLKVGASRVTEIVDRIDGAPNISPGPIDPAISSQAQQHLLLKLFEDCGMTAAFRIPVNNAERGKRVEDLVKSELATKKPFFRLLASSGHNYLHPDGVVWRRGLGEAILKKHASISVVLQSPFSLFAVARARANGVTHDPWEDRQMAEALARLRTNKKVAISVTGYPVNCSLFFTSKAVLFDPYLWGRPPGAFRNENNFWVFEFANKIESDYECYRLLEQHFDFLARESVPLTEILGEDENLTLYRQHQEMFKQKLQEAKENGKHDYAFDF